MDGDVSKGLRFETTDSNPNEPKPQTHRLGKFGSNALMDPKEAELIYEKEENAKVLSFTPEQTANHKEIAKVLNIKQGEQMPHYQADSGAVNPIKDEENCVFCTFAYELRRLGFNVTAKPYVYSGEKALSYIAGETYVEGKCEGYGILFNGLKPQIARQTKKNDIVKEFVQLTQKVGRYHLSWDWNEIGGHSIAVERLNDGSLMLYDGQSSTYGVLNEYFKGVKAIEVYRVDNATINPDAVKSIVDVVRYKRKTNRR